MSLLAVGNDVRWVDDGISCNWVKVAVVDSGESISDGRVISG